ncbi:MAG: transposase, partial [Acidobacteria bacterium]|nr:transposase [Acidobacteriota bacterium]
LRIIPEGGALVEVTCRTVHGRFLMKPSRRLNEIVLGVLARAQRMYPVDIVAPVFLSNHYHLLVWVPNAQRLAAFMGYLNGNLAKEAGRIANWREKFWGRRYQAIVVSDESAAQIARLEYILSHGVKEGLVRRPADWPGVNGVHALLEAKPLEGAWVHRTKAYNARMRGEKLSKEEIESTETVSLAPLPCWAHLDAATYREKVAELVAAIEEAGRENSPALALPQSAHERPLRSKRSPAPYFHCASKRVRRELFEAYRWFVAAYREATERLSRGDPSPGFPEGSFPPS